MNTEELTDKKNEPSTPFDAHEFDGLRQALEEEAAGLLGKVDEYVRQNPWLAIGVAAAAGFLVAYAARGRSWSREHQAETEKA